MNTDEQTSRKGDQQPIHKRRPRYSGKNPRRFEEKYKEHRGDAETLSKVLAAGKTPAGSHRPIMVGEILQVLAPKPGDFAVDCTLGNGGHTRALIDAVQPGGTVLALDADPIELASTRACLEKEGIGPDFLKVVQSNFAGLVRVLSSHGLPGADCILADLGVSSMQLDNPGRGFSFKTDGPLDMRMNPNRGLPASILIERSSAKELERILRENADEPLAAEVARTIAGRRFETTLPFAGTIRGAAPLERGEEPDDRVRRVFQAIRIAVNEEFTALDTFLRHLPECLKPGGRVAVLTFHSGEDRRVKKAFKTGQADGLYAEVARDVIRASGEEQRSNPRSRPAKLRWAIRA